MRTRFLRDAASATPEEISELQAKLTLCNAITKMIVPRSEELLKKSADSKVFDEILYGKHDGKLSSEKLSLKDLCVALDTSAPMIIPIGPKFVELPVCPSEFMKTAFVRVVEDMGMDGYKPKKAFDACKDEEEFILGNMDLISDLYSFEGRFAFKYNEFLAYLASCSVTKRTSRLARTAVIPFERVKVVNKEALFHIGVLKKF